MRRLLHEVVFPRLGQVAQEGHLDSAVLAIEGPGRVALTTDAYVVSPLFFPGGDIGRLAVYGTVNDLAMVGARPVALSLALILEEGVPLATVARVVDSVAEAAQLAKVRVVTGDTKVVERGKGDGLYVVTSGVGVVRPGLRLGPAELREGDAIVVSGDLGRHGTAILSVREGLTFGGSPTSDLAPLADAVSALLDAGVTLHALRDLTRGGLLAALVELAIDGALGMQIHEASVPVGPPVQAACELFGLDPLALANEGTMALFLPENEVERALPLLSAVGGGRIPAVIGRVTAGPAGQVVATTAIGTRRVLDLPLGETLPRIC